MVDKLKLCIKNRDFLALSELLEGVERLAAQNPGQRDLLLDELEIQTEDLKSEAVRMFDREEFARCLEIFEFLVKVKPTDRSSKDYLQICRQFCEQHSPSEANRAFATGGAEVNRNEGKSNGIAANEPSELTRRMRTYFDRRDFEALKGVVKEALRQDTKEPARQTDRRLQEKELKAEFETHVRNLKKEAIQQFESAAYSRCVGTFRFLCELEPGNSDLRRYLQGCLEFAQDHGSPDGSGLMDPTQQLFDTQGKGQKVLHQSTLAQAQLPSPPHDSDSAKMPGIEKSGIRLGDEDILEIPGVYQPDVSCSNTNGKASAKAWLNLQSGWLKLALPFGAVCLLIWVSDSTF